MPNRNLAAKFSFERATSNATSISKIEMEPQMPNKRTDLADQVAAAKL
jgi:hypothetical protein